MTRNIPPGLALLLSCAICLSITTSGSAADSAKPSKLAAPVKKEDPPPARTGLEPKAMAILKESSDRLAAAKTMSFTAVVTHENPSRLGPPLAYTVKSEVTLQRPDKLRIITPADGPASEFYYDGKKMTAFAPAENLAAVADAPPTIDAALQAANNMAAIYFPFSDLIVSDPYKDIADGLKTAFYMGRSQVVGGTTTEMIAYANDDVFIQAWIGAEDKLPRQVRAVYLKDRAALRHQLELSNWRLDPPVLADSFVPARAAGAKSIPFAHPNAPIAGDKSAEGGRKP